MEKDVAVFGALGERLAAQEGDQFSGATLI
jgi:hypothetical protein